MDVQLTRDDLNVSETGKFLFWSAGLPAQKQHPND